MENTSNFLPGRKIRHFAAMIFRLTKNRIHPSTSNVEGLLRGVYKASLMPKCVKKALMLVNRGNVGISVADAKVGQSVRNSHSYIFIKREFY